MKHRSVGQVALLTSSAVALALTTAAWPGDGETADTVRTRAQAKPGGRIKKIEMRVYRSPSDLSSVPAAAAALHATELVLGVVRNGEAMAYPIRTLAMFEVANDRVGKVPIAPTW